MARTHARSARPVRSMDEKINKWAGKTPLEVLQEIGADWQAEVKEIRTIDGLEIPEKRAMVNPFTKKVMGIVGDGFCPLHNNVLSTSMTELSESLGEPIQITEAFNAEGGKLISLSGKIGNGTTIIEGDEVIPVVHILQGNAGNCLLKFRFSIDRKVCSNGMTAPVAGMSAVFNIRHTKTIEARYSWNFDGVLRNFSVIHQNILENFRKFARHKMDKAGAVAYFNEIAKIKGDKDEKAKQTVTDLIEVWNHPRQTLAGESLWRAYNAATEYLQHWGFRNDESMLLNNLDGAATEQKFQAYQVALNMAA